MKVTKASGAPAAAPFAFVSDGGSCGPSADSQRVVETGPVSAVGVGPIRAQLRALTRVPLWGDLRDRGASETLHRPARRGGIGAREVGAVLRSRRRVVPGRRAACRYFNPRTGTGRTRKERAARARVRGVHACGRGGSNGHAVVRCREWAKGDTRVTDRVGGRRKIAATAAAAAAAATAAAATAATAAARRWSGARRRARAQRPDPCWIGQIRKGLCHESHSQM